MTLEVRELMSALNNNTLLNIGLASGSYAHFANSLYRVVGRVD